MSNRNQHENLFYLCTGFHRSGTSLLAQSMVNGGIPMGNELMGATFSNPLGHVEDMPAVRLHDKVLHINGADWRYADNGPLIKPNWLSNYIKRYLDERWLENPVAGVKDPRAVFFLKDWQMAGKKQMRYVFIYRHWSTAVNSILNRACRHIINSGAPVSANQLNFGFFLEPNLAFDMWKAANERIIAFYQEHADKCLMVSQDAFVHHNQSVQKVAEKIGLPAGSLASSHFESSLMTQSAPASVRAMLGDDKLIELEETWQKLQSLADVSSDTVPAFSDGRQPALLSHLGIETQLKSASEPNNHRFDLSELGWLEACGFLARMPRHNVSSALFISLLARPFTSADNFETLAKIAHRNGFFLITKLCKMRAMHQEDGGWKVANWKRYVDAQEDWLALDDDQLAQGNPFSLRPAEERRRTQPNREVRLHLIDWPEVQALLGACTGEVLEKWLTSTLLYRNIRNVEHFDWLADLAVKHGFWYLGEFACFKALRRQFSPHRVMQLGDIYRQRQMLVKALQCFEYADRQAPDTAAFIARMAEVRIALGDSDNAQDLCLRAQQLAPDNPVVIRCQQQLAEKNQQQPQGYEDDDAVDLKDMVIMPTVASHQDIVDLQREDADAGEQLDLHNLRMNFILRDNKPWLVEGVSKLETPAADCFADKIYQQWCKIFSPEVVSLELDIALPTKPSAKNVAVTPQPGGEKIAFVIDVINVNAARMLVSEINRLGMPADVFMTYPSGLQKDISALSSQYCMGKCTLLPADQRPLTLHNSLAVEPSLLGAYSLICRLHTDTRNSLPNVKGEYLQQIYALLLLPDMLQKVMNIFQQQPELGLVVPAMHPLLAARDLSDNRLDVIRKLADECGLDAPEGLYVYPEGKMFFCRPEVFQAIHHSGLGKVEPAQQFRLLPLYVKQLGLKTLSSQLI